jgi:hypothetical protein
MILLTFHETRRCITVLTISLNWSMSWIRKIKSKYWEFIFVMYFFNIVKNYQVLSPDGFSDQYLAKNNKNVLNTVQIIYTHDIFKPIEEGVNN